MAPVAQSSLSRRGGVVALRRSATPAPPLTDEARQALVERVQREIVAEETATARLLEAHQAELQTLEAGSPVKGLFLLALALGAMAVALAVKGGAVLPVLALVLGAAAGWLAFYAVRTLNTMGMKRQHLVVRFNQAIAVRKHQRDALDAALKQAATPDADEMPQR
ncbi:MAG: hypothetical protein IPK16_17195 [Anaerolineales bacterium]|nr:hypothetical protein [Anaerolineales bacterium]